MQVQGGGSGAASTLGQTNFNGQYTLSGLPADNCQITPRKSGDVNGAITALDAAYVQQALVGLQPLSNAQRVACDASGDGTVSAFDAALILQYLVGVIPSLPVTQKCGGDWAFIPAPSPLLPNERPIQPAMGSSCQPGSIAYSPLTTDASGQDFIAVLLGDCTGNWRPAGGASALAFSVSQTDVHLGRSLRHAEHVSVPLEVRGMETFQALTVHLHYDPSQVDAPTVRLMRRAQHAMIAVNDSIPGELVVGLASGEPIKSGTVLVLEFASNDNHPRSGGWTVDDATVE